MIIMKQRKCTEIRVNSACKKIEKKREKERMMEEELQVVKFVVGHQKPTFVLFCIKVGVNTTYL